MLTMSAADQGDQNMTIRLLRRPEVELLTGLSRSRIYAMINDGTFPRPVKTGPRAVCWVESEITDWQSQRIAERDRSAV